MKKELQNEVDIVGLIAKVQEQLVALDKKVDILMGRCLPKPVEAVPASKPSIQRPVHAYDPIPGAGVANHHHSGRLMHQATCADCKKECEIPFKPTGDRPVYCKECFRQRKTGGTVKPVVDNKPKELPPVKALIVPVINAPVSLPLQKKKSAAVKKVVAKKKPALKKKK